MKNYILIAFLSVLLVGCEGGATTDRRISAGQWTVPQSVGNNSILVQGYSTQDALDGANSHCAQLGRQMNMLQLTPSSSRARATITYSCY